MAGNQPQQRGDELRLTSDILISTSVVAARWATTPSREYAEFLPRFPAAPIPCWVETNSGTERIFYRMAILIKERE
jgi:hypothetical protein